MTQTVEMLEPTEGEPCQWLGVYITKWRPEWGQPSVMFRTADVQTCVPEVDDLITAARALLKTARTEYEGTDWRVDQWVTDEPTVAALDAALAPFQDDTE